MAEPESQAEAIPQLCREVNAIYWWWLCGVRRMLLLRRRDVMKSEMWPPEGGYIKGLLGPTLRTSRTRPRRVPVNPPVALTSLPCGDVRRTMW